MAFFKQFSKAPPASETIFTNQEEIFKGRHVLISQKDVEDLKQQLEDLCAAGIICPSEETRPVPKGVTVNMVYQMCYDYQWFADRSIPELFDDRSIETLLNFLSGNRIFTVLGLNNNLSQVPMFPGERNQPYSVRPAAFYETERMQPGYCEMLTNYQKMISFLMRDLLMKDLVVVMDYIVIFASTPEEHEQRVLRTTEKLREKGLQVALEKSTFCSGEFIYAGHIVLDRGILIAPDKVDTLLDWPLPKTVLELQNFLEFCAYYRHFYPGFSAMAKPLYRLLYSVNQDPPKKGTQEATAKGVQQPKKPWWTRASLEGKWTEECREAFKGLKIDLFHCPILKKVDMSRGR